MTQVSPALYSQVTIKEMMASELTPTTGPSSTLSHTTNTFVGSSTSEDDESSTNTALFVQPQRNGRKTEGNGHYIPAFQDHEEDRTIVIDLTEERQYVSRNTPDDRTPSNGSALQERPAQHAIENGLFPAERSPSLSDLGPHEDDGGRFLISRMLNGRTESVLLSPVHSISVASLNENEDDFQAVISEHDELVDARTKREDGEPDKDDGHEMGPSNDSNDDNVHEGPESPHLVHHEQEPLSKTFQRILSSSSTVATRGTASIGPGLLQSRPSKELGGYDEEAKGLSEDERDQREEKPNEPNEFPFQALSFATKLPELPNIKPSNTHQEPKPILRPAMGNSAFSPVTTPPSLDSSGGRLFRPKELNTLRAIRGVGPDAHSRNGDLIPSMTSELSTNVPALAPPPPPPLPLGLNAITTSASNSSSSSSNENSNHLVLHNKGRSRSLKRDGPLSLFTYNSNDLSLDSPSLISANANSHFQSMSSSGRLRSGFVAAMGRGGIDGSLDRRLASQIHRTVTRKSQSNDFLDRIDVSRGTTSSSELRARGTRVKAKMNKIEKNLYLGNMEAATDVILLESHGITHIITLDSVPLPRKISSFLPKIKNLHIQVTDLPDEDILSFITSALAFINEGIASGGNVLVHCFRGKSRSATVVTAFIMQKYNLSFEQALARVKAKRDCVNPHQGFLAQLKLYESMDYHLDPSNVQFKMFKLRLASERMRKAKILFRDSLENVLDEDPGERGSARGHYSQLYKCKKCRRTLATSHNVIPHVIGESPDWANGKWSLPAEEVFEGASDIGLELCSQSVFINPIRWMQSEIKQNLSGRLYCPNCQAKVGQYTWIKGCQCSSCKAILIPAFQLDVTEIIFKTKSRYLQSSGREPVVV
ncbi:hypothetical protein TCAL_03807 [Tigriopus californicus]|uniref:Protein-tyrosine-phosphatase n=1 Tax=Tigriopus californicus TaxID=6832 RepID=A0A553NSD1_TIGCA|nr:uncharacterized protein LOC131882327 [Tigriopus californicus]TRY68328.1 hypothetical protein TCAL_03807 [Tigriopus californicus]|eukprot:TCALIF_03807-PA protein Name:"Similar to Dusp12 Dual specificity protein phosphatase 12 (Mus musculus)" AED:0.29 eAED:0.29 QI:0/-1/0/1/-1/1/1/0/877